MNNLTNLSYQDIIKELNNRGYHTDFIVGIGDVEKNLEEINADQKKKTVLNENQMKDILMSCFNTEGFLQMISECIQDEITKNYK